MNRKRAALVMGAVLAMPMSFAQEQIHFTGQTTADAQLIKDALGSIADYLKDNANCPSVGDVESEILPEDTVKRDPGQPEGTSPATYELWTATSCGKQQSFLVVFWAAKEGGTMFRIQLGGDLANQRSRPLAGKTVSGDPITEDVCQILASTLGAKPELTDAPAVHALGHTEASPLKLATNADVKLMGLVCWRSEARLAPEDYLVPDKVGVPLFIKTDTGDERKDRTITLEKVGGYPRVRLLAGPEWTEAEKTEIKAAIAVYSPGK